MSLEEKKIKKSNKKEKRAKTREEFKKFVFRGNIIDLAVAVAVGSAFTAIVNSFVKDIIGGFMGYLMGDMNLDELEIRLGSNEGAAVIRYGAFLQTIIYFLIVAVVMFTIIKILSKINSALSKLDKKNNKEETPVVEKKVVDEKVVLLEEIRDLLKSNKNV